MSEWKVNKEINLGEMITMLVLVVTFMASMVAFFVLQDRRIEQNTSGLANVVKVNEEQNEQIKDVTRSIDALRLENKADMNRLDTKLDDIKNLIIQDRRSNGQ